MYRTTATIVASTLTYANVDDYRAAVRALINSSGYDTKLTAYTDLGKIVDRTFTLVNSSTMTLVTDWDLEQSKNDFYIQTDEEMNDSLGSEYDRTVTSETI
jgi:hypothetical protein